MTTAVTGIDDVQHVAATVAAGLNQLLDAEYWELPGADLLAAARTVEHLDALDPDGHFDPADHADLTLGPRDTRTGLTSIKGRLDDLTVAAFTAATDPHAKPRPEIDGLTDRRSAGTRLAQALATVPDQYLAAGAGPVQAGERPHVIMTVHHDALTGRLGPASWTPPASPSARPWPAACCATATSSSPSSAPPANPGHRPRHPLLVHRPAPRHHPARQGLRFP